MKVQSIHQIEITSRCNLRCKYCVHPTMARVKEDMAWETFETALRWVGRFIEEKTQGHELNLCGIGESTMHPEFSHMVRRAREVIGPHRELILATNGVGVTEAHAEAMREAHMRVWVSLHRPEKAGPTLNMLQRYGVLAGVSADPSIASVDWAGQVDWEVTAPKGQECLWLRDSRAFVAANGDVLTCCFDGSGVEGRLGTVWEDVRGMESRAYGLCGKCHLRPPAAVQYTAWE